MSYSFLDNWIELDFKPRSPHTQGAVCPWECPPLCCSLLRILGQKAICGNASAVSLWIGDLAVNPALSRWPCPGGLTCWKRSYSANRMRAAVRTGQQSYGSGPDAMRSNAMTKSRVRRSSADFPHRSLNRPCWLGQWTYPYILGKVLVREQKLTWFIPRGSLLDSSFWFFSCIFENIWEGNCGNLLP